MHTNSSLLTPDTQLHRDTSPHKCVFFFLNEATESEPTSNMSLTGQWSICQRATSDSSDHIKAHCPDRDLPQQLKSVWDVFVPFQSVAAAPRKQKCKIYQIKTNAFFFFLNHIVQTKRFWGEDEDVGQQKTGIRRRHLSSASSYTPSTSPPEDLPQDLWGRDK